MYLGVVLPGYMFDRVRATELSSQKVVMKPIDSNPLINFLDKALKQKTLLKQYNKALY